MTSFTGLALRPVTALIDRKTGELVGCDAIRLEDEQLRSYLLHQLRADGGSKEIFAALENLPPRLVDPGKQH